jgi:hypothetical protein
MQDFDEFAEIYGHIESQHITFAAMASPAIDDPNESSLVAMDTIRLTGFIPVERKGEDDVEPFIAEIHRKEPLQPEPRRVARTNADKLLTVNHDFGVGTVKQLPDKTRFYISLEADQFDRLLPLVIAQALVTIQIIYAPPAQKGSKPQIMSLTLSTDPDLRDRDDEDFEDDYLYDEPDYPSSRGHA